MSYAYKYSTSKSHRKNFIMKLLMLLPLAALFTFVILTWAGFLTAREALGGFFLFLAIDFLSPQPDFDLVLMMGVVLWTRSAFGFRWRLTTMILIAYALTYVFGFLFLLLAVWFLGISLGDGWGEVEGTWAKAWEFFTSPLFFVLFYAIVAVLLYAWIYQKKKRIKVW